MDKPTERDLPTEDSELIEHLIRQTEILRQEIHKVVFGQEQVIEELLIALLARGHALLIGVPGLAKTLLVKTLSPACWNGSLNASSLHRT